MSKILDISCRLKIGLSSKTWAKGFSRQSVPNRVLNPTATSRSLICEQRDVLALREVRQLSRQFSTNGQQQRQNRYDTNKELDEEEDWIIVGILSKVLAWILGGYLFTVFVSQVFPDNQFSLAKRGSPKLVEDPK